MATTENLTQSKHGALTLVLARFPDISLAIVFGSMASGLQRDVSDLDIAVSASRPLTVEERIELTSALAESSGRPVDLIDLKCASEPLLGQILRHGKRLLGSNTEYAKLMSRHVFEQADFMPYRKRVLAERRATWIGM